jgi:hypothetical protein
MNGTNMFLEWIHCISLVVHIINLEAEENKHPVKYWK